MQNENMGLGNLGHKLGFIFSYFLFTTVLYVILMFFSKSPSYLNLMVITSLITAAGILIRRYLR